MEKTSDLRIFFTNVKEATFLLRAINNKCRQDILRLLEQHSKLTVTEILIHLRLLQSITSQHLAILRRTRLVTTRREGKHIYYGLNHQRLVEVNEFVNSLLDKVALY